MAPSSDYDEPSYSTQFNCRASNFNVFVLLQVCKFNYLLLKVSLTRGQTTLWTPKVTEAAPARSAKRSGVLCTIQYIEVVRIFRAGVAG